MYCIARQPRPDFYPIRLLFNAAPGFSCTDSRRPSLLFVYDSWSKRAVVFSVFSVYGSNIWNLKQHATGKHQAFNQCGLYWSCCKREKQQDKERLQVFSSLESAAINPDRWLTCKNVSRFWTRAKHYFFHWLSRFWTRWPHQKAVLAFALSSFWTSLVQFLDSQNILALFTMTAFRGTCFFSDVRTYYAISLFLVMTAYLQHYCPYQNQSRCPFGRRFLFLAAIKGRESSSHPAGFDIK